MANLDTRSKRASSVQILLPFLLAPILPDGALDQADRQHMAHSYSGILASGGAAPATLRLVRGPLPRRRKKKRDDEEELLLLL